MKVSELAALVQSTEAAAEAEVAETPDQAEAPPIDPNQLIGVMDPEAAHAEQETNGSPWGPGTDAVGEQAPASDPIDDAVVAVENAGATDGSDEPVSSVPRRAWSCRARPVAPGHGSAGRTARSTGPTRATNRPPLSAWRPSSLIPG
jgi:hypothetical protein